MEERQIIRCYKFGVYHLLPGQTTEYQGLSNTQGKKFLFLSSLFFFSPLFLFILSRTFFSWKTRAQQFFILLFFFRGTIQFLNSFAGWFESFPPLSACSLFLTNALSLYFFFPDTCTPAFTNFMHWLGEPIRLCGWKGYRAGLDVAGKHTTVCQLNILFVFFVPSFFLSSNW